MEAFASTYAGLVASDEIISRVLKISEVAQLARAEKRLRDFFITTWNKRKAEAIKKAQQLATSGRKAKEISNAIDRIMEKWFGDVEETFGKEFEKIYETAAIAGYKKATRQTTASLGYEFPSIEPVKKAARGKFELVPSFTVADRQAVEALRKHQVFWIGKHYTKNVSPTIANVVRETVIETGVGTAAAGKILAEKVATTLSHVKLPTGFRGTDRQYFEALAANTASVSRSYGQMRSFMEIGITHYKINAVGDKRTCGRCSHMDGKEFTTQQGAQQMSNELALKKPDQIKAIHPWPSMKQLEKISPNPGPLKGAAGDKDAKALADAGLSLPPFHFKCRCTVDISVERSTYENLEPMTMPTPKIPARVLELKPPAATMLPQDKIYKDLITAKPISMKPIGEGVNGAHLMEMRTTDGRKIKAVWKASKDDYGFADEEWYDLRWNIESGKYAHREAAIYRVDREMGKGNVVPPTVRRDPGVNKGSGSLQYFEEKTASKGDLEFNDMVKLSEYVTSEDDRIRRMFLLDVIGANDDRHDFNIMFRSLKKGKKFDAFAIDNGLSFPCGEMSPDRFFFPTQSDFHSLNRELLSLDEISIRNLKKLKLERVAKILSEEGIEREAIRPALVRIKALQNNPDELESIYGRMGLGYGQEKDAVVRFIDQSVNFPEDMVSHKDLRKIDQIIKKTGAKKFTRKGDFYEGESLEDLF